MREPRHQRCAGRNESAAVRLARLAARQEGVVNERQLRACGLDRFAVRRWVSAGRLHRRHPGVFTVGHRALTRRGRLIAALFFGGEGAALSHRTAAWWWQLIPAASDEIHISARIHRRPIAGVVLHRPRNLERVLHHRLPVTPVPSTLLDLASDASYDDVRKALAQADYRNLLDVDALRARTGRGLRGSTNLRAALEAHLPELAKAESPLEEEFMLLCERSGLTLPVPNAWVGEYRVDALWPTERVIAELDGKAAHSSEARRLIDHERDMKLRTLGYVVRRYSWHQVFFKPATVAADLSQALASRRDSASPALR